MDRTIRGARTAVREARELVRYRAKLGQLRSGLKAQAHAVMAKVGVLPGVTDMFGPKGQTLLDAMELADAYLMRVESSRGATKALASQPHRGAGANRPPPSTDVVVTAVVSHAPGGKPKPRYRAPARAAVARSEGFEPPTF